MINQKGVAHVLVLLILLAGLAGGLYLVSHPQIFKPKASETNINKADLDQVAKAENSGSVILANQYDNSPPQAIYNSMDKFEPMKKVASLIDLNYKVVKSQDEVQISITDLPEKSDSDKESEAQSILSSLAADKEKGLYEIKILGYMLANEPSEYFNFDIPFTHINIHANPQGTPQIDPYFALCKYVPEETLKEMGFTRVILWGKGSTVQNPIFLNCSDPAPSEDEIGIFPYTNRPSIASKYKFVQPPASVLVNFLEAGIAAREQMDQSAASKGARFIARYLVPIFGPQMAALVEPGADPKETVSETNFSTGAFVLFMGLGPAVEGLGGGAGRAIEATGVTRTVQVVINSAGKTLGRFTLGGEEAIGQVAEEGLFNVFKGAVGRKGTETTVHVMAAPKSGEESGETSGH